MRLEMRRGGMGAAVFGQAIVAVLAAGALCLTAGLAQGQQAQDQQARHEQALSLVNEARREAELEALALNETLVAAAEAHAEDMLERDYYGHVSPEGETVRDRFLAEGGGQWRRVAENIASCQGCPTPPGAERVRAFQEGWMESPEHRENILDPGLEEFGFAMEAGGGTTYGVQTFAGPGRPEGLASGEPEEALPAEALGEAALAAVNRAREAEGLEPLEASPVLAEAAARLTEAGAVREAALGEAMSAAGGGDRRSVGMVSGECGGCGSVPTRADMRSFVEGWLEEEQLARTLLDPQARSFGFALTASGEGRKGAVALAGRSG